jgi:thioesterase domain-containing protein
VDPIAAVRAVAMLVPMQTEPDANPAQPDLHLLAPTPEPEPDHCPARPEDILFPIRSCGEGEPLYLVHGIGGGMDWGYENLARQLPPGRPVYGFRCRARRGAPEHRTIEAMATEYVAALLAVQPEGPYHLGGYCFGGNVAFEMARQLDAAGHEVGVIVLVNSVPANCRYDVMRWTPVNLWKFVRNLAYWAVQLSISRTARTSELLKWKWRTLRRKTVRFLGLRGRERSLLLSDVVELADLHDTAQVDCWTAHLRAFYRFQPLAWNGRVLLLRTRGHQMFCTFDPDYGWSEFALGGVEVRVLAGEHESILEDPHVTETAQALGEALAHFDANRSSVVKVARSELRRVALPARLVVS